MNDLNSVRKKRITFLPHHCPHRPTTTKYAFSLTNFLPSSRCYAQWVMSMSFSFPVQGFSLRSNSHFLLIVIYKITINNGDVHSYCQLSSRFTKFFRFRTVIFHVTKYIYLGILNSDQETPALFLHRYCLATLKPIRLLYNKLQNFNATF